MEYSDYLRSDQWKEVSRKRREMDGYRCVCCGSEEGLNVHHVRYPTNWFDTKPEDLRTLCKDCHVMVHRLREQYDNHALGITRTTNGYIAYDSPAYNVLKEEHARTIAIMCWKKNLFKSFDNTIYIHRVQEIVNYEKHITPVSVQNVWDLLAFAKDCYIENENPTFNKGKRKAKKLAKTKYR